MEFIRESIRGQNLPSEKPINHYSQYTNDSVLEMFASQKKPIPQWILHLLPAPQDRMRHRMKHSILEENLGSQVSQMMSSIHTRCLNADVASCDL